MARSGPSPIPPAAGVLALALATGLAIAGPTLAQTETAMTDTSIVPFTLAVPQEDLDDLNRRLDMTRWPGQLPGTGWSRGVELGYLKSLTDYWRHDYDWRRAEARINGYPQFTTTIDGQNFHFLHVRSPEPNARPLLLLHGWPGSILEFLDIIGPLSDPRAHGLDPDQAFHVIVGSLPGFGLSGPITETGWSDTRIAEAYVELMARLGYDRFGAHGEDAGAMILREMGVVAPERLIGLHLTLIFATPSGEEANLEDVRERKSVEAARLYDQQLSGYAYVQAQRPQTIGYLLNDSPVGQLAWIVEKLKEWSDLDDVPEEAFSRDDILTNVMLYWLTQTGWSSAHHYAEGASAWGTLPKASTVPTGVASTPDDLAVPIRRIAERNNTIVHWSEFDRGGHFAAWEEPELIVEDIRAFFAKVR